MLSLYRETLVNLQITSSSSITTCEIPASNTWTPSLSLTSNPKPNQFTEIKFTSEQLATDGAIYFRKAQLYPRCFLWRVLDEGQTLEIRSADLVKSRHETQEANRLLRLRFPARIIPGAVAFADAEGQELIHCFVITDGKQIYTLTLQSAFFKGTESPSQDIYTTFEPSFFQIDRPYRLFANSPYEIFISYENGTLQRLTRKAGNDGNELLKFDQTSPFANAQLSSGSQWMQHNFDEKVWGASFRGIVKWQGKQSIRFEGRNLNYATAAAITASSDSTYAFTVCLNHTIRVWNLTTGNLVITKDLLDQPHASQELSSLALNPAATTTIKLFKPGHGGQAHIVTFSPHNEGYFKFWQIKGSLTSQIQLEDAFPNTTLKAPDPDPSGNSVWSMTGFEILPTESNMVVEMWILWRNNNYHQLYSIKLNLTDIERSWSNDWVKTVIDPSSANRPMDWNQDELCDPSTRWLDHLLRPEIYSANLLETALGMYQDVLKCKVPSMEKRAPLAQRLCSTINSCVSLRRYGGNEMDYDKFESDADKQWQNLWRIAESLRERQMAPIALSIDSYSSMPWILMADYCAAIREGNDVELLTNNSNAQLEDNPVLGGHWSHRKLLSSPDANIEQISALFRTASTFRHKLPLEMLNICHSTLETDLFQDSEYPIPMRLVNFYETCDFNREVSDETYEAIMKCLESFDGFLGLSNEIFYTVLDLFPENVSKPESSLISTEIGQGYIATGARDVIENEYQMLFDLLLLVVFLECELNAEDSQNANFDGSEIYAQLHTMLREYSKKQWLAKNHRYIVGAKKSLLSNANEAQGHDLIQRSLLHDLFARDIRPQPTVNVPQSFVLTQAIEDVIAWTREHDNVSFEDGLVHIQCDLLVNKDIELARDFLRYQPTTSWSAYIKGRLYLVESDFDNAAQFFRKAAHSLARGKAIGDLHESSAGLLSLLEAESFHNGLPKYFQHVLALFESAKCYSQAATFARLAIQSMPPSLGESEIMLKQDLLARLFMVEINCSRYKSAYMALSQYTDQTLQRAAMRTLVTLMFSSDEALASPDGCLTMLQDLPLGMHSPLSGIVDDTIHDLASKEANVSAGSSTTHIERAVGYLNVLHAYRLQRKNYQGAVAILVEQMAHVQKLLNARSDEDADDLRSILLSIINTMSCAPSDEAYVLKPVDYGSRAEDVDGEMVDSERPQPRAYPSDVLTLREMRRDYQLLLDKHSRIERGDFDFAMDGESDE